MATRFTIEYRMEKNGLHLRPRGDLDGSTAWQMINLISDLDDGCRRIFIDTCRLGRICPFGRDVFRWHMRPRACNLKRVFFKGEKGGQIAPPGCRGDCENCTCRAGEEKKATIE